MYTSVEQLEQLKARSDLDTICAWDYQRMKSFALQGEGLHVKDYKPELRGIDTLPKMWALSLDSFMKESYYYLNKMLA